MATIGFSRDCKSIFAFSDISISYRKTLGTENKTFEMLIVFPILHIFLNLGIIIGSVYQLCQVSQT